MSGLRMASAAHSTRPARNALQGLGQAVAALGDNTFPDLYLGACRELAGVDMVSAFAWPAGSGPRYIFSSAVADEHAAFARLASQRYASAFWKHDPAIRRLVDRPPGADLPVVYQQSWRQIPASDYRVTCYEQPGVEDRVSLTSQMDGRRILVNVYRRSAHGAFTQDEVGCLADSVQLLTALAAKHAWLADARETACLHPDPGFVQGRLHELFPELSRREREVCAELLVGHTVKEIARARSLELSSVITYKRRAYLKLRVSDRRGLVQRYSAGAVN